MIYIYIYVYIYIHIYTYIYLMIILILLSRYYGFELYYQDDHPHGRGPICRRETSQNEVQQGGGGVPPISYWNSSNFGIEILGYWIFYEIFIGYCTRYFYIGYIYTFWCSSHVASCGKYWKILQQQFDGFPISLPLGKSGIYQRPVMFV